MKSLIPLLLVYFLQPFFVYTRHTSGCLCVGFIRPRSLTRKGRRQRRSNRLSRFVLAHPGHLLQ
jgi:hypothetical protein